MEFIGRIFKKYQNKKKIKLKSVSEELKISINLLKYRKRLFS